MKTLKQSLYNPEKTRAALNAFFNICEAWKLNDSQKRILLGNPSERTFYQWKKKLAGSLSHDHFERISYILGIYKALHILFTNYANADAWITKLNKAPLFGGKSALERMLSGNVADLYLVRQYLDAERGGWS
jgi:hypothetical protein